MVWELKKAKLLTLKKATKNQLLLLLPVSYTHLDVYKRQKSLYITRLVCFENQVFGLTQNNFLVEILGNQVKKTSFNQFIKNYRILKIKSQNERLYLNTDNGIFVYDFFKKNFYKKLSYNQDFEFSQISEVNDKAYIAVNRGILAPVSYTHLDVYKRQGLYRYDGKNYTSYTLEEQTSKSGSGITEDIYGRIWYSNFDGYIYYVETVSYTHLDVYKRQSIAYFKLKLHRLNQIYF